MVRHGDSQGWRTMRAAVLPVDGDLPAKRVGEHQPHAVALVIGAIVQVREQQAEAQGCTPAGRTCRFVRRRGTGSSLASTARNLRGRFEHDSNDRFLGL